MTKKRTRLDPLSVYVGDCFTQLRKQRGLSQTDVASRLDITASAVSYQERGLTRFSLQRFVQTCAILNVDPADILTGILQEQPQLIREWTYVPTDPNTP